MFKVHLEFIQLIQIASNNLTTIPTHTQESGLSDLTNYTITTQSYKHFVHCIKIRLSENVSKLTQL